jgi:hypothetical protein
MAIKREDLVPKILDVAGIPPIHNWDEKSIVFIKN